jgi:hypothetical protein
MSNYHLRDKNISLKAKGLLSQMLSLPEDWDYTLSGLAYINREQKDAIRSAVGELERAGYVQRRQTTDASGKFSVNEYVIHECPVAVEETQLEEPLSEEPLSENPTSAMPVQENPTQLNINISRKDKLNTHRLNTDSLPSVPQPEERREGERVAARDYENYRAVIRENIGYDQLVKELPYDVAAIDEILELMLEVVCAHRSSTRVAGTDVPQEVVRSRFLKLNGEHILFVLNCLQENTTKVRNIKQYLLTVLYNAPVTISNYYTARVNHDLYGDDTVGGGRDG